MGSHCLFQEIFSALSLLHCRQILYHLSLLVTSKNDTELQQNQDYKYLVEIKSIWIHLSVLENLLTVIWLKFTFCTVCILYRWDMNFFPQNIIYNFFQLCQKHFVLTVSRFSRQQCSSPVILLLVPRGASGWMLPLTWIKGRFSWEAGEQDLQWEAGHLGPIPLAAPTGSVTGGRSLICQASRSGNRVFLRLLLVQWLCDEGFHVDFQ